MMANPTRTPAAWMITTLPSLQHREHTSGVDDVDLPLSPRRFVFPILFPAGVTLNKHYRVTSGECRRERQVRPGHEVRFHYPLSSYPTFANNLTLYSVANG